MTTLLLPLMNGGRVVTVSSGGMYSSGLPAFDKGETLEMPAHKYGGSKQYAIAKRAQVTLTEMWATARAADRVRIDAPRLGRHPGSARKYSRVSTSNCTNFANSQ